MTDVDFDRVESDGDLQSEIADACIQHEEGDLTEEEQVLLRAEEQAGFQKFKNKILRKFSLY